MERPRKVKVSLVLRQLMRTLLLLVVRPLGHLQSVNVSLVLRRLLRALLLRLGQKLEPLQRANVALAHRRRFRTLLLRVAPDLPELPQSPNASVWPANSRTPSLRRMKLMRCLKNSMKMNSRSMRSVWLRHSIPNDSPILAKQFPSGSPAVARCTCLCALAVPRIWPHFRIWSVSGV